MTEETQTELTERDVLLKLMRNREQITELLAEIQCKREYQDDLLEQLAQFHGSLPEDIVIKTGDGYKHLTFDTFDFGLIGVYNVDVL